jgi:hypothetical protein
MVLQVTIFAGHNICWSQYLPVTIFAGHNICHVALQHQLQVPRGTATIHIHILHIHILHIPLYSHIYIYYIYCYTLTAPI